MQNEESSFGFDVADSGQGGEVLGTGVGVVRVAKRDYAIGLHWNAVEQPTKAVAEARELAASSSFSADYYCIRSGATPQFGLGFRAQGHKAGMPSLAAHVAQAKGGSWIGLFQVVGGYYLVAVRDDAILSECDRFFSNADDARATFEDYQNQSDWSESIAPRDLDIPDTVPTEIEVLLDGKPQVRLKEVSRSSNIIRLALAGLAVAGILVGGMFYMNHMEELRLQEEAAEALRNAINNVSPQDQIEIPPMPWEGKKMATPLIKACVDSVMQFPTDIPGWSVVRFRCDGEQAAVGVTINREGTLGQGGGSINWIEQQVKDFGHGVAVSMPGGGSGNVVLAGWPLEGIPDIPVDLKTAPLVKMKQALLAQFEERMVPITFSEADNTEFWRGFNFRFTTKDDPMGFADVIGALPGVMMNSVDYDVLAHEWILEGKAYEQLPLPKKNAN